MNLIGALVGLCIGIILAALIGFGLIYPIMGHNESARFVFSVVGFICGYACTTLGMHWGDLHD